MKRRFLFLALAVGVLALGFGALDARAGNVPLPTTYNNLLPSLLNPTPTTTVTGAETLTFSNFTYSSSSNPLGSAIAASSINVSSFALGNETGFSLTGTLSAPANTVVDVSISYVVTAPVGQLINDAILVTAGGPLGAGGTGTYAVNETLTNAVTFAGIASLSGTNPPPPGAASDFASFAGVNSILVSKDIRITGGSNGESLSIITQAFSSTGVPEPASFALLGIGMTGFLALRRFFKKTHVA
jgi:hypothetical protein